MLILPGSGTLPHLLPLKAFVLAQTGTFQAKELKPKIGKTMYAFISIYISFHRFYTGF